jgi:dolichol-phosphate mannosyltransferase
MRVAVVLPAHNEAGNLTPLVDELVRTAAGASIDLDVVVVDDGSVDGTASELATLRATVQNLHVVTHPTNRGFGQALRTGIAAARERGCDAAVFMDSDLSHRPADVPALVQALDGRADVAIGSRFVPGCGMVGVPLWRVAVSRAGNVLGRLLLGMPLRDLTSGYRAVRRRVLDAVTLSEDGFTIQLEWVVKTHAAGFRLVEVPITLSTRRHGISHMFNNPALFVGYYRLLMKCRAWMRKAQA